MLSGGFWGPVSFSVLHRQGAQSGLQNEMILPARAAFEVQLRRHAAARHDSIVYSTYVCQTLFITALLCCDSPCVLPCRLLLGGTFPMERIGTPNQQSPGVTKKGLYAKCSPAERAFVVACVVNQLSADQAKLGLSGNPREISFKAHSR